MSQQEILLAVGLAALAFAITADDLLFSLLRHRRRQALRRTPGDRGGYPLQAREATRNEALRRRLAAIQASSEQAISSPSA